MSYNDNANRPHKTAARSIAAINPRTTPARLGLWLTTPKLLDLLEARETGVIGPATRIIVVESDLKTATATAIALRENGFTLAEVYHSKLELLDLDQILKDGEKIDFAFLDFCNQFTAGIASWLRDYSRHFADDAAVSMTFCTLIRSNKLLSALHHAGNVALIEKLLPASRTQLTLMYGCRDMLHATILGAYGAITAKHSVSITDCIEYNDTSPMVMVRFQLSRLGQRSSKVSVLARQLLDSAYRAHAEVVGNAGAHLRSVKRPLGSVRPWEYIRCPETYTPGQKAASVRRALTGKRPWRLSPAEWACCPLNPKSHLRSKLCTK
jgi:hypothetical protein